MDFNDVIKARRSIRKFDPSKQVSVDAARELISSAQYAPSWKNSQTARYYCVLSSEAIEEFRANCLPEFNATNSHGASYIVTTFVKERSGFDRDGNATNECGNGWGYYDLGLANENLVLKATDMGLDTLIMGIRDEKIIRTMLNIPENEIIVSVIAVGYRLANPEMPKRRDIDTIVNFY